MNLDISPPSYSFTITFIILASIMITRYFIMAGFMYLISRKLNFVPIDNGVVSRKQIKRDIFWSVLSSFVFAVGGTVLVKLAQSGMTKIYFSFQDYPWWYLTLSLAIYLFLHDTYFYWTHRLLHHFKFKQIHYVHHESRTPSAWTSFSFHPIEALIQAVVLPLLVVSIPVHIIVLMSFLLIMSILGILNHLGYELYPRILEKKLSFISATHHQYHHGKVDMNFGLYFTFWDKWMGTNKGPDHV